MEQNKKILGLSIRTFAIVAGCIAALVIIVVATILYFILKTPDTKQIQQPAVAVAQTTKEKYVAMGDSYSSGFGSEVTPPSITTDESIYVDGPDGEVSKCYRSTINAAHLLAAAKHYQLTDVSCSGATTDMILTSGQYDEPAQIEAIKADTKIVTLTIGGNDIGFLSMVACLRLSECTSDSPTVISVDTALKALPLQLTNVLSAITKRAPNAQIRIAGYPIVFPRPGQPLNDCEGFLSTDEQIVVDKIQTALNTTIEAAAMDAGSNVKYIDPAAPGSPFVQTDSSTKLARDACSPSPTKAINGPADTFATGAYHPNSLGYKYYETLYAASL